MEYSIPIAAATSPLTRVGLYGGSFDPIHLGHLKTAIYVLEYLKLERMYFMPNASPPHKASLKLGYDRRVNMIEAALKDFNDPRLQISFLEQDHKQKHYTYDTLKRFKQDHPQAEMFFIIGMDSFLTLNMWKNYEQLIDLSNIVILPRPHYELKDLPPSIRDLSLPYFMDLRTSTPNILDTIPANTTQTVRHNHYYLLPAPEVNISSTQLRELLKTDRFKLTPEQAQLLNSTLSPRTMHYINEHQLYH